MNIYLISIFLVSTIIPFTAHSFNVGKYRLGMTTAQAKSIGYFNCRVEDKNEIECTPTGFAQIGNFKRGVLVFDGRNHRLIEIRVMASVDKWNASGFHDDFINQLELSPCEPNWGVEGVNFSRCYAKPSFVRTISLSFGRVGMRNERWTSAEVRAEIDPKQIAAFLRTTAHQKRERSLVQSIEGGR